MRYAIESLLRCCLAATLLTACMAAEVADQHSNEVGLTTEALELGCLFASADATAELGPRFPNGRDILTADPLDTSVAQNYGSFGCSGFVSDFTNPNGYNINRVWVIAGGWIETPGDQNVFGTAELCANLTLEADVYGYRNGVIEPLGSVILNGEFRPKDDGERQIDRCHLSYEIVQPGNFEAIRVIGRVSNETATYPFRAHVG